MWWFGKKMIYGQTMEYPGFFNRFRHDLVVVIEKQQASQAQDEYHRLMNNKTAIKWVQWQTYLNIAEREHIMQYGLWQDYGPVP